MPNVYEITFLIKEGNEFTTSKKSYPVEGLDKANNPNAADFCLGFYGSL